MAEGQKETQAQETLNTDSVATRLYKTLLYSGLPAPYNMRRKHLRQKLCHPLRRPYIQRTLWGGHDYHQIHPENTL